MQYLDFREPKEHGSFGFPIELYHVDLQHPRYEMNYHWHKEYELIRVVRGSLSYVIETKRGVAKEGEVLFVNSGLLHAGVPDECAYDCIVFDLDLLLKPKDACHTTLRDFGDRRLLVNRQFPEQDAEIGALLSGLYEAAGAHTPGGRLATKGLLYQLFGHVVNKGYYHAAAQGQGVHRKIGRLKQTLELIENSYGRELVLEELAAAAGMTPKYFCQFFREMTGRTPIDYLNYHRVEVACLQLATGAHSVTEVAYECGFNDLSYFIRVFKRYKGITPKRYVSLLVC